ncbi:MAG: hypothetical protein WDO18_21800 [Acidobacteriota bacterium]
MNSFTGPWAGGIDLTLERQFQIKDYGKFMFRVTGFNLLNHANYNVYSGSGVNQQQYRPVGPRMRQSVTGTDLLPGPQQCGRWLRDIHAGPATHGPAYLPVRRQLSVLIAIGRGGVYV